MQQIGTILLPTQFSELCEGAAVYARILAERFGAEVHVLHVVVEAPAFGDASGWQAVPVMEVTEDDIACAREFADRTLAGVRHKTEVRTGPAAETIVAYAREINADLIIIGTHADGLLKRIIFGSVAKQVLESAGCPVLMVPRAALEHAPPAA